VCNCEDRPCCGCGQEESQQRQHEAWIERQNEFDDSGVFDDLDDEQCEDDDDEPRNGGDESLDDLVGEAMAEDAYLDDQYENHNGDFD